MANLPEEERYKLGYSDILYELDLEQAAHARARKEALLKRHVVKAPDMPWEKSRHGLIKHLIHERMDYPIESVDMYMLVLPPGGRSGKHRHMAEEIIHVLEGTGHDMHWDPEIEISDRYYFRNKAEGVRYDWDKGDFIYIPPMVAHQHFNNDPKNRARLLAASNRIYRKLGFDDLEQLEDAPE